MRIAARSPRGNAAMLAGEDGQFVVDWTWQPLFVLSVGVLACAQLRLFRAMARNRRAHASRTAAVGAPS